MNAGRTVVTVGCVYELAALYSRLPTITELVTRPRRHPVGWLVTCAWLTPWLWHFRPRKP